MLLSSDLAPAMLARPASANKVAFAFPMQPYALKWGKLRQEMNNKMRKVAALLGLALLMAPDTEAKQLGELQYIGGWMVGAYSDGLAPQFTHCSGTQAYPSGVLVALNIAPDSPSTLTFYSALWSLTEKATYPLELAVDDVALGTMRMQATSAKKVAGLIPSDDSLLLQPLQRGHVLRVRMQDQDWEFALRDFARMADEVMNCTRRNAPEMASRRRANPPVVLPGAVPTPPTPVPASAATGKLVIPVTAEERADAEAFHRYLNQAGALPGAGPLPTNLNAGELRERIAAWKTPTTIGSLHVVHPQEAPDADAIASLLIGTSATGCREGVFTSASVRDPEIAVRRVSTSCQPSGRPTYERYLIMPNGAGLYYVISTYAIDEAERAEQAEDRIRNVLAEMVKQTLGPR